MMDVDREADEACSVEDVSDQFSDVKIGGESTKPTCLIVLGMAGSGKTTFVQRITAHLHAAKTPPYVVNLDPACYEIPYPVNIDIRETVKYKEVMKQYSLGPNGGIITSLNLFSTRFEQVVNLIDKRSSTCKYVIFDTPGQIEVFTWSASGMIITESLASTYPTVVVYVMDIVRSVSPVTFMSNMLYACSILYKTKLPFVVVMNKIDVVNHHFALEWMRDFTIFQEALEADESYSANLTRSLSLVLDEFYSTLRAVGISALTGVGVDNVFVAINEAVQEYDREYKPEYEKLKKEREQYVKDEREHQLRRLEEDVGAGEEVRSHASAESVPVLDDPIFISPGNEDDDTSDEEYNTEHKDDSDKEEGNFFRIKLIPKKK